VRCGKTLLSERANTWKEDLTGVAIMILDRHGCGRVVVRRDLSGHSCVLV
jgi:hypothetical protein